MSPQAILEMFERRSIAEVQEVTLTVETEIPHSLMDLLVRNANGRIIYASTANCHSEVVCGGGPDPRIRILIQKIQRPD